MKLFKLFNPVTLASGLMVFAGLVPNLAAEDATVFDRNPKGSYNVELAVKEGDATYPLTIDPTVQQTYLTGSRICG
jgi:hypothetical protein